MVLEHAILHVVYLLQIEFGHEVLVHVQQDVSYHINAHLSFFPLEIEESKETIIMSGSKLISNWSEQLDSCFFDIVVEHLPMFVEN